MDKASEVLLALQPVMFRYKKEIDPAQIPQFGLVAEEVEKVTPNSIVRNKEGKAFSVRYDQVNAMLLNEFLKEHRAFVKQQRKVEELRSSVAKQDLAAAKQQAFIARQEKQIEELAAGLQKVSAELEVSKSAPKTVLNNR